ncbi:MAG: hypothetical protein NT076_01625 [Candidatus Pacearchaeota archaeon]|nr:hypothetical protein [Candidatus Pacearchaeota archaeon]
MEKNSAYCFHSYLDQLKKVLSRSGFSIDKNGYVRRVKLPKMVAASGEIAGNYLIVYNICHLEDRSRRIRLAVSRLTEIARAFDPFNGEMK